MGTPIDDAKLTNELGWNEWTLVKSVRWSSGIVGTGTVSSSNTTIRNAVALLVSISAQSKAWNERGRTTRLPGTFLFLKIYGYPEIVKTHCNRTSLPRISIIVSPLTIIELDVVGIPTLRLGGVKSFNHMRT
uniref:Uncharacterized protein n=1 Tax=Anopheles coluzzii TaxID=1518534 RepID=A0A8W7PXY1_ANOCL